jgi:hypothetical protein
MSFHVRYIVTVLGRCEDPLRKALTMTRGRELRKRATQGCSDLPKRAHTGQYIRSKTIPYRLVTAEAGNPREQRLDAIASSESRGSPATS